MKKIRRKIEIEISKRQTLGVKFSVFENVNSFGYSATGSWDFLSAEHTTTHFKVKGCWFFGRKIYFKVR